MRNLNLTLWNAIRECWSSVSDSDSDSELDSICSLGFRSHHPLRLRLIHGLKLRYSNWDFQTLRPAHFMLVDRLSAAASLISHLQLPNCLRSVDLICILNMLISYDGLQRSERVLETGEGGLVCGFRYIIGLQAQARHTIPGREFTNCNGAPI